MFGQSVIAYCYLSKEPFRRVLVSTAPESELPEDTQQSTLEIKCCAYSVYFNKRTEQFAIHCDQKADKDWIELPWCKWVDVENPNIEETFTYQFQTFSARMLGQRK